MRTLKEILPGFDHEAVVHIERGEHMIALALLECEPDFHANPHMLYAAGYIHYALNAHKNHSVSLEKAAACAGKAIRINPLHAPSYELLGNVYRRLKEPEKVIMLYERALDIVRHDIDPDEATITILTHKLAWAHARIGNTKEARRLGRQILAVAPDDNYALSIMNVCDRLDKTHVAAAEPPAPSPAL